MQPWQQLTSSTLEVPSHSLFAARSRLLQYRTDKPNSPWTAPRLPAVRCDVTNRCCGHRGSSSSPGSPTDRRGRSPVGARRLTTRHAHLPAPAPLTASCGPPHQSSPRGPTDSDSKLPSQSYGDRAPNISLLLRCALPPRVTNQPT